jgi:hypothetical protein
MQFIDRRAEYSTITVTLLLPSTSVRPGGAWDPFAVVARAWADSLVFWRRAAEVVIILVVFTWWLVIPGVGLWWFLRRRRRPRPTPAAA